MISLFRRSSPPEPIQIEVRLGTATYPVTVKRLASARRYTLRVRTAQRDVVLSMPEKGSLATARAFADKHAGWIALRIGKLSQDVAFADGAMVPLRDVPHRIEHRPGRGTVKPEAGSPPVLAVFGDPGHLPRRLTDWLRKQALKELQAAVTRHTQALGVKHGPVSVKDTASRWGSCSSSGALAFSWRLILAPPFVLDYLAAHEVSHLQEMNHSPRFWRLCRTLCPRTDEAKAWLKSHGAGLHRYG
ncbi:M48 family metallopeptidase [Labrys monachus]|uniref:Metal-dependent hydrolase n=1 Tax=Labrys monachus TaxID=217067 RepID=A0ABU0FN44_9HYPH|nr:SprT family zinc-dependent metalloprotease [Labrys monachus]MDQ0396041.1 putative metal-dependent hydrolase [Labrys monachus]